MALAGHLVPQPQLSRYTLKRLVFCISFQNSTLFLAIREIGVVMEALWMQLQTFLLAMGVSDFQIIPISVALKVLLIVVRLVESQNLLES